MNQLSYNSSIGENKIPVAELIVDDVPLAKLLGRDDLIGFDGGISSRPPLEPDPNKTYVLAVCSCGYSECGSVEGRIISPTGAIGETTIFKDFKYASKNPILEFTRENYTSVIRAIEEEFHEFELQRLKKKQEQELLEYAHKKEVVAAYLEALVQLASLPDLVDRTARTMHCEPDEVTALEIARWLVSPMIFEERRELVDEALQDIGEQTSGLGLGLQFSDGELLRWSLRVTTDDTGRKLIIEGYSDDKSAPFINRTVDLSAIL
ncbi:MAG: hypothetical protein H6677_20045 [Candidatus Obscuribacterales bacterium]|nr:hypothetical protein [Candidatus Obscuribacterales bacterium]